MGIKDMTNGSRNVFIICCTVMFCFVIGAAVAVGRFITDGPTALGVVTLLFTNLGIIIATLTTVIKGEAVKAQVAEIKSDTNDLLNGAMDAKLSAAVKRELTTLLDERLGEP